MYVVVLLLFIYALPPHISCVVADRPSYNITGDEVNTSLDFAGLFTVSPVTCIMATPIIGKLPEFDKSKETWTCYAERLDLYFSANKVDNAERKRSILLTACGADAYKTLRNLIQPEKLIDKSYTQLVALLEKHYHPAPSTFISRYKFHTRTRQAGESIGVYVAHLKEIGQHCSFGDDLNNSVRDRLVIGVNDTRIQRRLLQETDLTFEKAFDIAQSMELSNQELSIIQRGSTASSSCIQVSCSVLCYLLQVW